MRVKTHTTFGQKIGLGLFGVLLAFVVLELVLRAASALVAPAPHAPRLAAPTDGEVRVLTIGESTTAFGDENSYPRQLERVLNARASNNKKYVVINAGKPAVGSGELLEKLPAELEALRPHVAVIMMGINDAGVFTGQEVGGLRYFLQRAGRYSRLFRLLDLLVLNLSADPATEETNHAATVQDEVESLKIQLRKEPRSAQLHARLAFEYSRLQRLELALESIQRALKLTSRADPEWLYGAGLLRLKLGEAQEAVVTFEKFFQVRNSPDSYIRVARLFHERTEAIGPDKKDWALVKRYAERALKLAPDYAAAHELLGHYYLYSENSASRAEAYLKFAYEQDDANKIHALTYAESLQRQKKYDEAVAVLKRSLQTAQPSDEGMLWEKLALVHRNQGQMDLARSAYLKSKEMLVQQHPLPEEEKPASARAPKPVLVYEQSILNYVRMVQLLKARGVLPIAMQYPARDVSELKDALKGESGVVFVDNRELTKQALESHAPEELFLDKFAGDFGHFTPLMSQLIAENVAGAIESAGL